MVASPLFHIRAEPDTVRAVHLPHFVCLAGRAETGHHWARCWSQGLMEALSHSLQPVGLGGSSSSSNSWSTVGVRGPGASALCSPLPAWLLLQLGSTTRGDCPDPAPGNRQLRGRLLVASPSSSSPCRARNSPAQFRCRSPTLTRVWLPCRGWWVTLQHLRVRQVPVTRECKDPLGQKRRGMGGACGRPPGSVWEGLGEDSRRVSCPVHTQQAGWAGEKAKRFRPLCPCPWFSLPWPSTSPFSCLDLTSFISCHHSLGRWFPSGELLCVISRSPPSCFRASFLQLSSSPLAGHALCPDPWLPL
ncbi:unnamed protein product, partial [Caretta caretta]